MVGFCGSVFGIVYVGILLLIEDFIDGVLVEVCFVVGFFEDCIVVFGVFMLFDEGF